MRLPWLKVFGEGEWKVRKHGAGYRRVWRKLHLAVDAATHEVVAALVTESTVGDAEVLPERKASAAIPPRANAAAWEPLPAMAACIRAARHWK